MIIDYVGVKEINGSLIVIDGVEGVSYEEIVDIRLENGTTRQGRVVQIEGKKIVVQVFEGTIIAKKHGGIQETVTVRRLSYGVGVEKVFPIHSPHVAKFELIRKGKVRRAKLYYLRGRVGKAAKVKQDI